MKTTGSKGAGLRLPGYRDERVLEAVGVGAVEEGIYQALVDRPGASLTEVAASTGITLRLGRKALASLEAMGLVSRTPTNPPRYVPAPPGVAVEVLVLRRQEDLARARLAAVDLQDRFRAAVDHSAPGELVEMVSGREAASQRFVQLQRMAKREVLIFDRPPYWSSVNEVELELLDRGIRYRVIYDQEALETPGQVELLHRLVAAGEEARTLAGVPVKCTVADGRLGLLTLSLTEPGRGALILHPSPLLEAITMLFETLWDRAPALRFGDAPSEPVEPQAGSLSPEDEHILVLLAAGLKDEAIARQLSLSHRTVQRKIRHILDVVGARTRFQAGLQVRDRGWLPSSSHKPPPLDRVLAAGVASGDSPPQADET